MEDPVVSKYGHIYDRKSIEEWLRRKGSCPFTYKPLGKDDLIPLYSLRYDIMEYRKRSMLTTCDS